ncbi:MAG: glycosyltransferase family 4 protein [Flavobacteriaceae bacterium]|jgi:glycosyltransferase involved in cell wall biosynthesis|nr:glycosyltransferase family 4 protein [Flavobacteriaceae bacterium]
MKILLFYTDLYHDKAGGGQFVTRKFIEQLKDFTFYYFIDKEKNDYNRPNNTQVIKLGEIVEIVTQDDVFCKEEIDALKLVNRFARCVKNRSFDFVEFPDYSIFGNKLRMAFEHHNVKVDNYILSLHGNISKSMELNWDPEINLNLIKLERQQFVDVDIAYGISKRYINENLETYNRNVLFLNPIYLLNIKKQLNKSIEKLNLKPSIYFIGRLERRKGPDTFIEIVKELDSKLYNKIYIIGDDYYTKDGKSARKLLLNTSKEYNLNIHFLPPLGQNELLDIYASESIVILPVRYDSFNLVAMDAIFNGCVLALSKEAGVCDFLDMEFPKIPYIKIENINKSISDINDVLSNFKNYKNSLSSSIREIKFPKKFKEELMNIYKLSENNLSKDNHKFNYIEKPFSFKYKIQNILYKILSKNIYNKVLYIYKKTLL